MNDDQKRQKATTVREAVERILAINPRWLARAL